MTLLWINSFNMLLTVNLLQFYSQLFKMLRSHQVIILCILWYPKLIIYIVVPRTSGLVKTPVSHLSRGGITKARSEPAGEENMLHVEVGEEDGNVSDDSDIMYVGTSMGPPRTAEEQKCTPKVERPDSPLLPPDSSPIVMFSALSSSIKYTTPNPSPVSPAIDDEKPSTVNGKWFLHYIVHFV